MSLNKYTLCIADQNNMIQRTDKQYRARDELAAAKKAYRDNKQFNIVYILNEESKQVFVYDTSSFFQEKKGFKRNRYGK